MKSFLIRKFLDKDFNFFFGFFIGVIFLTAIVIVTVGLTSAFKSDVDAYREKFKEGYPVKFNSTRYLDSLKKKDLLMYAETVQGVTYNVEVSFGEKTEEITLLQHGMVIINIPKKGSASLLFHEGDIYLSPVIAESFACKKGNLITVADRNYRFAGTYDVLYAFYNEISDLLDWNCPFIVCDRNVITSSYTTVFFNMDDAISFCKKIIDPADIGDDGGVLDYYKGMNFLRKIFIAFAVFVAFLCILYYAVTISIYMMRKKRSREIVYAFGGSSGNYAFSVATCFSIVSLLGAAFGLLMAAGLRRIVEFWAIEIIGCTLEFSSFLLTFGCVAVASVLVIGALTFVFSRRVNRDSVILC